MNKRTLYLTRVETDTEMVLETLFRPCDEFDLDGFLQSEAEQGSRVAGFLWNDSENRWHMDEFDWVQDEANKDTWIGTHRTDGWTAIVRIIG